MKLCSFVCITLLFSSLASAECFKNRGVIELGSGKTKAIIARVNTCVWPWVYQPLELLEAPIQYRNETIMRDGLRFLNPIVMTQGEASIKNIIEQMHKNGVTEIRAIATSVFRDQAEDQNGTVNGHIYLSKLREKFKLSIEILTQSQEAILATEAAITEAARNIPNLKREELVIWDIGGGSSQIVVPSRNSREYDYIYLGAFGSVLMQEYVNRFIKNLPPSYNQTANPISLEQTSFLKEFVKSLIAPMDNLMRNEIRNRKYIIGIGGVHKYSACELIYGIAHCTYTQEMLQKALEQFSGMTDSELFKAGRCPEVEYCRDKITNAVMLQTIMQDLNIEFIKSARASAKEGVLVTPSFWKLDKR